MKHLAAYLLLTLGGNSEPSAEDIKEVLASVGIDADEGRLDQLLNELRGRDINEVSPVAVTFEYINKGVNLVDCRGHVQARTTIGPNTSGGGDRVLDTEKATGDDGTGSANGGSDGDGDDDEDEDFGLGLFG